MSHSPTISNFDLTTGNHNQTINGWPNVQKFVPPLDSCCVAYSCLSCSSQGLHQLSNTHRVNSFFLEYNTAKYERVQVRQVRLMLVVRGNLLTYQMPRIFQCLTLRKCESSHEHRKYPQRPSSLYQENGSSTCGTYYQATILQTVNLIDCLL